MIKLIYLVSFLFATVVQINASHLEDIDLNAAQAVLTNAKSSFASKSNKGTLYQNIYTEARKRTPLKGSDAESLFLDLYISTCFLAHQEKGQQPENLSDDLYSQMLAPLGGTPYAHLSALELTGILSRVRGIHKPNGLCNLNLTNLDPFHNTFANLMTGRGRFKLKESTEEKRQQLIMDIYRYYNLNHPITGHLNKEPNFTFNLLWSEIMGGNFDLAAHLSSGSHDIHQEHAFNCFIISYLASDSPAYRLLVDYESAPEGVFKKLKSKLGEENYRKHEQQIRGRFFYFYKTISSQIMDGQYTEYDQYIRDKSQCDQSKLKLLDGFYASNLQNGTLDVSKINRQIQLASEGDVMPSLQSDIEPLLRGGCGPSRCRGFHNEKNISNAATDEGSLAGSLGALSSQVTLTPYVTWVKLMDTLVGKGTWDREGKAKKVWDAVNGAVGSDQALRKGLFSFLEHKVGKNKVLYAKEQKVNDPRFVLQKTQKEKEEDERREKEEKIQLQKLPNELSSHQQHWNLFLKLEEKIKELNGAAVSDLAFKKGIRDIVAENDYKKAYRALALKIHPDKSGGDASPYKKQWGIIHTIDDTMKKKEVFL